MARLVALYVLITLSVFWWCRKRPTGSGPPESTQRTSEIVNSALSEIERLIEKHFVPIQQYAAECFEQAHHMKLHKESLTSLAVQTMDEEPRLMFFLDGVRRVEDTAIKQFVTIGLTRTKLKKACTHLARQKMNSLEKAMLSQSRAQE